MGPEWNGDPGEVGGPGDIYPIPPESDQIRVCGHLTAIGDEEGLDALTSFVELCVVVKHPDLDAVAQHEIKEGTDKIAAVNGVGQPLIPNLEVYPTVPKPASVQIAEMVVPLLSVGYGLPDAVLLFLPQELLSNKVGHRRLTADVLIQQPDEMEVGGPHHH